MRQEELCLDRENRGDVALGLCLNHPLSSSLLYVFIFLKHPPPPQLLSFLLKERKRRQRREEGVAISFRVPAHLIGSWQHMEL